MTRLNGFLRVIIDLDYENFLNNYINNYILDNITCAFNAFINLDNDVKEE